jgi:histidyl-tRNA synthetase
MSEKRARISPVRGTRDFYPEVMAFHRWLAGKVAAVSELFGYVAYDGPILERLELYAAKSGDELVKKQAFVLTDRGGELLCMRPELTPTLARMIAQRQKELRFPVRWYSFGPFWRYEKPQRGRAREFFQWNLDLLGVESVAADAEVVAVGAALLRSLGLTAEEVVIKVSSRGWMSRRLAALGISEGEIQPVLHLIDRRDKTEPAAWAEQARELGLSSGQLADLQALLEDREGWKEDDQLQELMAEIEALGVAEMVAFDPGIVRGLDYYTGVVFEAKDRQGRFRSIFGGGRYDDLVSVVGGKRVPGVGFAMGDIPVRVVLEALGKLPELPVTPVQALVTVFNAELRPESLRIAQALRARGIAVEQSLSAGKLGKQLKRANTNGIPWVVICGPDEAAQQKLLLRNMHSGEQQLCTIEQAAEIIAAGPSS